MVNSAVTELNRILLARGSLLEPVYAKIRVASDLYGLPRTELFSLMARGKVDYIHYKRADAEKGVRLINLASLRAYLETFKAEPKGTSKGSKSKVNPEIKL